MEIAAIAEIQKLVIICSKDILLFNVNLIWVKIVGNLGHSIGKNISTYINCNVWHQITESALHHGLINRGKKIV